MAKRKTPAPVCLVPESLKQQLLWAFNQQGEIDLPMFRSILTHEGHEDLPRREVRVLAHELSERACNLLRETDVSSTN